jgi:uroporphyrinogen decarboxylase
MEWTGPVTVYYRDNPPTGDLSPEKAGISEKPDMCELIIPRNEPDYGPKGLQRMKNLMGDGGLVGIFFTSTVAFRSEEAIYTYYDNEDKHEEWARQRVEEAERRFAILQKMPIKPDFLCVGGSGTFVFQTEEMFRKIAFPAVKRSIELLSGAGYMTHIHSCGPETRLVEIMAEETNLTVIDPLEIPPMGNCNLADLKRRFGKKLTLKGNLHTTNTMLRGTPAEVRATARQAILDAGEGGRFILSTGDQCGRDTPPANVYALVEAVETYGRYNPDGTLIHV